MPRGNDGKAVLKGSQSYTKETYCRVIWRDYEILDRI